MRGLAREVRGRTVSRARPACLGDREGWLDRFSSSGELGRRLDWVVTTRMRGGARTGQQCRGTHKFGARSRTACLEGSCTLARFGFSTSGDLVRMLD